jgi:S-sulfo-L-cysteine synthase (3-phospho-L-serine-dependent)
MTPSVLFVESNTTGTGRLMARAAVRLGYRPVVLAAQPGRYPFFADDAVELMEGDTATEEGVLGACARAAASGTIAGVTSSSDYFMATAARAADALGLPGANAFAVEAVGDKAKQRGMLAEAGVASPASRCVLTEQEAARRAHELSFPVVVKPRSGSGSVGVRLCHDAGEVARHAARLLAIRENERGMPLPEGVLVERFVEGDEYSVEVFAGEVVGITRKHLGAPPCFLEVGHDFPARVGEETRTALADAATAAVRATGLEFGAVHVELRVNEAGPWIIEVNPRLAGGYIPELVRRALGVDLVEATVRRAVGERPDLRPRRDDVASIRFLVPEREGVLGEVSGLASARAQPGIVDVSLYKKAGDPLVLRGDFRDRVGHVIACGPDPASVAAAAEAALGFIEVTAVRPERAYSAAPAGR